MKVIHWLDKHFEEGLSAILLAAMSVVVLLQIILKWFHLPLSWSEEMARYMFIWLIYIASSYAVKKRSHIKVEILSLLFKEKGNFILDNCRFSIFSICNRYRLLWMDRDLQDCVRKRTAVAVHAHQHGFGLYVLCSRLHPDGDSYYSGSNLEKQRI